MTGARKLEMAKAMFPDELKEYMDAKKEGAYTLLDVRQPGEYEEAHLPGAMLIPLPQLADSVTELDSGKTTIVYCAVGGRSRMAAQLLAHHGFSDVYHLEGGMDGWEEPAATGPREFHLKFVRGDESPAEVIKVAFHMEEGLKRFHQEVKERTEDPGLNDLLTQLIRAEEKHERRLLELLSEEEPQGKTAEDLRAGFEADVMEGGIDIDAFMGQNEAFLKTVSGYMELAMMIETQALDLYLRMAHESRKEATKRVLLSIGDEEKAHLSLLGRYLEEKVRKT